MNEAERSAAEEWAAYLRLPPGFRAAMLVLYRQMEAHPGGRYELLELQDGRVEVLVIQRRRIYGRAPAPGEQSSPHHAAGMLR